MAGVQSLTALDLANEVRVLRAKTRRRVHGRHLSIFELLENPPTCIQGVPLAKLLTWQPGIGLIRARGVLNQIPEIWDINIHVGRLSLGTRMKVIESLRAGSYGVGPVPG